MKFRVFISFNKLCFALLLAAAGDSAQAAALEIVSAQTRGNSNGVTATCSAPASPDTSVNPANDSKPNSNRVILFLPFASIPNSSLPG